MSKKTKPAVLAKAAPEIPAEIVEALKADAAAAEADAEAMLAEPAPAAPQPAFKRYVSAEAEETIFPLILAGKTLLADQDNSGRLIFKVPAHLVPNVERHSFVKSGRIKAA